MEQLPSQDKNSTEAGLLRGALPFASDAWHGPEHVQPDHDTSLNRYFHRLEWMQAMARGAVADAADIQGHGGATAAHGEDTHPIWQRWRSFWLSRRFASG